VEKDVFSGFLLCILTVSMLKKNITNETHECVYRLTADTKKEQRDLRSLNAIKTIVLFLMTNALIVMMMPLKNTVLIEQVI
jgi:hypothetical protein